MSRIVLENVEIRDSDAPEGAQRVVVEEGRIAMEQSPLRRAPHTAEAIASDDWDRPYGRERGAFPADWIRAAKFWPAVGRIDNAHGDRNLFCTCVPVEGFPDES